MAHSYRKTPIFTHCKVSIHEERICKQYYRKAVRVRNRIRIKKGLEPLAIREIYNVWDLPSDGKFYWHEAEARHFRK